MSKSVLKYYEESESGLLFPHIGDDSRSTVTSSSEAGGFYMGCNDLDDDDAGTTGSGGDSSGDSQSLRKNKLASESYNDTYSMSADSSRSGTPERERFAMQARFKGSKRLDNDPNDEVYDVESSGAENSPRLNRPIENDAKFQRTHVPDQWESRTNSVGKVSSKGKVPVDSATHFGYLNQPTNSEAALKRSDKTVGGSEYSSHNHVTSVEREHCSTCSITPPPDSAAKPIILSNGAFSRQSNSSKGTLAESKLPTGPRPGQPHSSPVYVPNAVQTRPFENTEIKSTSARLGSGDEYSAVGSSTQSYTPSSQSKVDSIKRRKKKVIQEVKAENIDGFQGNKDIDELLKYIDPKAAKKEKQNRKSKTNVKSNKKSIVLSVDVDDEDSVSVASGKSNITGVSSLTDSVKDSIPKKSVGDREINSEKVEQSHSVVAAEVVTGNDSPVVTSPMSSVELTMAISSAGEDFVSPTPPVNVTAVDEFTPVDSKKRSKGKQQQNHIHQKSGSSRRQLAVVNNHASNADNMLRSSTEKLGSTAKEVSKPAASPDVPPGNCAPGWWSNITRDSGVAMVSPSANSHESAVSSSASSTSSGCEGRSSRTTSNVPCDYSPVSTTHQHHSNSTEEKSHAPVSASNNEKLENPKENPQPPIQSLSSAPFNNLPTKTASVQFGCTNPASIKLPSDAVVFLDGKDDKIDSVKCSGISFSGVNDQQLPIQPGQMSSSVSSHRNSSSSSSLPRVNASRISFGTLDADMLNSSSRYNGLVQSDSQNIPLGKPIEPSHESTSRQSSDSSSHLSAMKLSNRSRGSTLVIEFLTRRWQIVENAKSSSDVKHRPVLLRC